MNDEKITDRIHAELLALQSLAVADIAFYKEQQWKICNHALVIYAVIVAIPKFIAPTLSCFEYSMLGTMALIPLLCGIYLILDMGKSLAKGRDRLPALRKHFDREISLRAYAAGEDPAIALLSSKDKLSLERFFIFILIAGFFVTVWILYRFATA